jgi:HEAT repeat protein
VGGPREVEPLIEVLDDTNAGVRAQAARALGEIGDRRAVSGLLAAMGDRFAEVRNAAAAALAVLGEPLGEVIRRSLEGSVEARRELAAARDPRAVAPLSRALETHDTAVKEAAIASLVELAAVGVEGAGASLKDAVDDPNAAVRASAMAGLGKERNAIGADRLIAALADRDAGVRLAAARALGELGDRRAVDRLMEQLSDADPGVRAAVAAALAALGDPSGELVLQVLEDSDTARAELARRADSRAVAALIRLGTEGSPSERLAVARTLELAPWPVAVPSLIASLEQDHDVDVRATAARALGAKRDARAIEPLLLAVVDLSSEVRTAAVASLDQLGEPLGGLLLKALEGSQLAREELVARSPDARIAPVLIKALEAAEVRVRVAAAWTLWALPDDRAVDALIYSLQSRNQEVRLGAAGALGALGDRAAVAALLRCLSDLDVRLQRTAAWGLGRIAAPEAVPDLLRALNSPDADTRELVVVALGAVGDEPSRSGVRRALTDPSPHVRAAAQRVMAELAQQDAGSKKPHSADKADVE